MLKISGTQPATALVRSSAGKHSDGSIVLLTANSSTQRVCQSITAQRQALPRGVGIWVMSVHHTQSVRVTARSRSR